MALNVKAVERLLKLILYSNDGLKGVTMTIVIK